MTGVRDTPTTIEGWRQRAIEHYQESRAMMARFEELSKPTQGRGHIGPPAMSTEADRTYAIAANETQAAIAAAAIADVMTNGLLADYSVSGPPFDEGL